MTTIVSSAALQSPIEYQRRESKSNSLGRNMKPPSGLESGLRPHSSASMDRSQQPCLLSYNTSLPSLHPPPHCPASKAVSQQLHLTQSDSDHVFIRPVSLSVRFLTHVLRHQPLRLLRPPAASSVCPQRGRPMA